MHNLIKLKKLAFSKQLNKRFSKKMSHFQTKTSRERIVEILKIVERSGITIFELSEKLDRPVSEIIDDLQSIFKSSKHKDFKIEIRPPICQICGFKFDKSLTPSKCPSCKKKKIEDASVTLLTKKKRKSR